MPAYVQSCLSEHLRKELSHPDEAYRAIEVTAEFLPAAVVSFRDSWTTGH